MSTYESTFICSPELPAEKIDEIVDKVKKLVETSGGQVTVSQQLGRKRLAYNIGKFREGSYVYMELSGTGQMVSALENFFKVNDPVIRYLTVKVEKKKPVVRPAAVPPPVPAAEGESKPAGEVKPDEHTQSSAS